MPRPSVVIDPDQQRPVLPLRVPISVDIEFCARALAIEHGRPNRKIGKHRVRAAALALAELLIHEQYVPDVPPDVIDSWCRYLVHDLGEFPPEALDQRKP